MTDRENRTALICAASEPGREHAVPAETYWTLIIAGTVERYCGAACLAAAQSRRYAEGRRN